MMKRFIHLALFVALGVVAFDSVVTTANAMNEYGFFNGYRPQFYFKDGEGVREVSEEQITQLFDDYLASVTKDGRARVFYNGNRPRLYFRNGEDLTLASESDMKEALFSYKSYVLGEGGYRYKPFFNGYRTQFYLRISDQYTLPTGRPLTDKETRAMTEDEVNDLFGSNDERVRAINIERPVVLYRDARTGRYTVVSDAQLKEAYDSFQLYVAGKYASNKPFYNGYRPQLYYSFDTSVSQQLVNEIADLVMLRKDQSGRHRPFFDGLRPQLYSQQFEQERQILSEEQLVEIAEGRAAILSKDEGGRHKPFFNGYRPQFYFRHSTTGDMGVMSESQMEEAYLSFTNVKKGRFFDGYRPQLYFRSGLGDKDFKEVSEIQATNVFKEYGVYYKTTAARNDYGRRDAPFFNGYRPQFYYYDPYFNGNFDPYIQLSEDQLAELVVEYNTVYEYPRTYSRDN